MLIKFELEFQLSIEKIFRLLVRVEEKLGNILFEEQCTSKDTHDLKDWTAEVKFFFDDSDETIGDDSHMYLDTDSTFAFSPKGFDAEVLLNPLEKSSTCQR